MFAAASMPTTLTTNNKLKAMLVMLSSVFGEGVGVIGKLCRRGFYCMYEFEIFDVVIEISGISR